MLSIESILARSESRDLEASCKLLGMAISQQFPLSVSIVDEQDTYLEAALKLSELRDACPLRGPSVANLAWHSGSQNLGEPKQ